MHCFLDFGDHLYESYFVIFSQVNNKSYPARVYFFSRLLLFGTSFSDSSFSLTLSYCVCFRQIRHHSVFTKWSHTGDDVCQSAWTEIRKISIYSFPSWRSRRLWYLLAIYWVEVQGIMVSSISNCCSWSPSVCYKCWTWQSFKKWWEMPVFLSSPREVWVLIHRPTLSSPRGKLKLTLLVYLLCSKWNSVYQPKPLYPSFPGKVYCTRTIRIPRSAR